ncbi:hypothetical protein PoB_001952000 [Plakobranchus ocellatus]|uniref:Uncharacterized protein n=1 Tax=Plakobranchus ocellatus TaxID=259542 RepID=A0AAV3ZCZ6_9GAST|nr:hypothetical protein PoB_001952000 [Plakobranchus ocellatus]
MFIYSGRTKRYCLTSERLFLVHKVSPHRGDLRLSGTLAGQGKGGGIRTVTEGFLQISGQRTLVAQWINSMPALISVGTIPSRVRAPPIAPGLTEGPESLR